MSLESGLQLRHSSLLTWLCDILVMTASTVNYLWSIQDVLGQGATASVYKARNKVNSDTVILLILSCCV